MFRNLLIRRKLTLIMMVTSCVTLTVSFAAWLSYDSVSYRNSLVRTLDLLSEMIGSQSGPAAISDEEEIRRTLDFLRRQERVRRAVFFSSDGHAAAIAGASEGEAPIPYRNKGHFLEDSVLLVYRPIVHDGEEIGTIAIEADMSSMSERLGRFGEIFALVLFLAMVVSFVISYRLQEVISQPILHLTDLMRSVSDRKDYSLRARRSGRDEIGFLTDAFNDMLQKVQNRDAELEQNRGTLEEKVTSRTRELLELNRQLRESMDEARQAAVAKSQFLANMSHEIRTPMNGILGMNELLLNSPLNEQQRSYGEIVKSSAESLLEIINDILDFSKIEAGKLLLERIEFDPYKTVEDVVGLLAGPARKKGLELVCWIAPNIPPVLRGDPTRLRQVITNLVGNAIKFTESGRIAIRVSLADVHEGETDEVTLQFDVEDTGIGISPERTRELFQSFSQGDASMTRRYGGTGLGLAISRQLTEMMRGQIGVESELGVGSRFWFTARFETILVRNLPFALPEGVQSPNILVIDGSAAMREFLHHQLDSWELRHSLAADLDSAVTTLEQGGPFTLVLFDEELAKKGDPRVARLLARDIDNRPHVTLISWGVFEVNGIYEQMGVDEVIRKPIRPSRLFDVVLSSCVESMPAGGDEARSKRRSLPRRSLGDGQNLRILLAEDNKINQLVASKILARGGYTCHVVSDGRQAVEAVRSGSFDVVLMDCQMPELDGFEATRQIRAWEESTADMRRMHIIALTANAMKGDRERCLQAGMDDYLSKPVKPEVLLSKLDVVCAMRNTPSLLSAVNVNEGSEPFDVKELMASYEGRGEELRGAIQSFESASDQLLSRLRFSLELGYGEDALEILEDLRLSLGVLASDRLRQLAQSLAARVDQDDLTGAGECFDQLHSEWTRCRAFLPELVARMDRVPL